MSSEHLLCIRRTPGGKSRARSSFMLRSAPLLGPLLSFLCSVVVPRLPASHQPQPVSSLLPASCLSWPLCFLVSSILPSALCLVSSSVHANNRLLPLSFFSWVATSLSVFVETLQLRNHLPCSCGTHQPALPSASATQLFPLLSLTTGPEIRCCSTSLSLSLCPREDAFCRKRREMSAGT